MTPVLLAVAVALAAPSSFTAVVRQAGGSELVAWQAPESFAARTLSGRPMFGGTWARDGTVVYRFAPESPVSLLTGTFAAAPDAPPLLQQLRGPMDFVLARVRAGALTLRPAGTAAWRVQLAAPANKCAGFGAGRIDLRLRRADLLPLRLVERHGSLTVRDVSVAYRQVGGTLGASTFVPPPGLRTAYRENRGFVRATPAAARKHLSYAPVLPRSLPDGFRLAVSGWAPRSATTGAEGSIAPMRQLFTAVYRHGTEEIAVTERLAPAGGWPSDPFGAECVTQFTERVDLGGGVQATYATSVSTTPHLYWRRGRLLYTVSGPFPRAQLAAIARSLAP